MNPKVFYTDLKKVKAIVLGADPSTNENVKFEYLDKETSDNDEWEEIAVEWVPKLTKELDEFDPQRNIPVLVTAERIYKFLNNNKTPKARDIYMAKTELIEFAYDNKLKREIIPFYRHFYYSLKKNEWEGYKKVLNEKFR